jgi:hypothetical protein
MGREVSAKFELARGGEDFVFLSTLPFGSEKKGGGRKGEKQGNWYHQREQQEVRMGGGDEIRRAMPLLLSFPRSAC